MWCNLLASVVTFALVVGGLFVQQWALTTPQGDFGKDCVRFERVLNSRPCLVESRARAVLGETCLGSASQSAKRGDFSGA